MTTIYDTYREPIDNSVIAGAVEFRAPVARTAGAKTILTLAERVILDGTSSFSVDLPAGPYEVTFDIPGLRPSSFRVPIVVPDTTTAIRLASLISELPAPSVPSGYVASIGGLVGAIAPADLAAILPKPYVVLTQAQYTALTPKDPQTLYVIT